MKTSDFYFDLPEELIAQVPLKDRTTSRLMVLDKNTGDITHKHFYDIVEELEEGDCLVLNNTKVIPARLFGSRKGSGGKVELLLLTRKTEKTWEVLVKPGRKARIGEQIEFGEGLLIATVKDIIEDGNRIVEFEYEGIFEEVLDKLGEMPLPPYIHEKLEDKNRYQTVYAKYEGSAAAPTAGLHFTEELLDQITSKGVTIAYVTLHVGLGTFRPVKTEDVLNHEMHSEYYSISKENAKLINKTKERGGRVIAVGTTSTRTLESNADEKGYVQEGSGWTNIFIYPGYTFKCIDGLITNFHLPESTLIMLVSALASKEYVLAAYEEAVREKYRFFSFGDAMFIKGSSPHFL
ncbi:tRNA preQ1(34) S-adenosylmethionine ribosyltransferase-isomerase QueA [Sporanaerobium hydrogeniformans]|uniref:tRNA preQ1(34) S-adenosylmethionine ribosyltransferase-isomerase QueA n=1 Tax=Sporanaerobium hydrogeniformans TaxID=3072179 RepID=A0AC61DH98_9FIRM|nr:tRNA preQ1(34) S-adenosylmethionine ribosyltransferase-isomerase QueA [Sporanaerobium hydrogeniformans]PHV72056.1 tRNA preQ1(34) S-adenosylmethionine ribosyltransferase-isomerase QueA [Sporanaerobium hydrogeniformans]